MKVKFNDEQDDLYCCYCKERINLGDKYIEIKERDYDEEEPLKKTYHTECIPEIEDEDEQ